RLESRRGQRLLAPADEGFQLLPQGIDQLAYVGPLLGGHAAHAAQELGDFPLPPEILHTQLFHVLRPLRGRQGRDGVFPQPGDSFPHSTTTFRFHRSPPAPPADASWGPTKKAALPSRDGRRLPRYHPC